MDFGQPFHRESVIGIEDQRLPQKTIRGRNIAGTVCADAVAVEISRLFTVEFALLFGTALS
jgi:hypothetical protein